MCGNPHISRPGALTAPELTHDVLIPPPPPPLSGDETCLKAWKRICSASRKEFQAIYDRLGVTINERGESFYNPRLKGIVEELKEQVRESVRAAVFPGSRAHQLDGHLSCEHGFCT